MNKLAFAAMQCALLLAAACGSAPQRANDQLSDYVDVFIGTGGHGHTFPGATRPHGMVQLSPDTRLDEWDACGGYYVEDDSILGFSHTHLSGTGCGDLGDFLFTPFEGDGARLVPCPRGGEYRARFDHATEQATPGYYRVTLSDGPIQAELTATERAAMHRYTFGGDGEAGLMVDAGSTVHYRHTPLTQIKVIDDSTLCGMKFVRGWANGRTLFFYARFSQPFGYTLYDGEQPVEGDTVAGQRARALLRFGGARRVMARVAISPVDCEGARRNLSAELPHWDFDQTAAQAREAWNRELARIEVHDADERAKRIFYTALYHTAISPCLYSDVDGRYRTMTNEIAQSDSYTCYHIYSLWDTFRALHPLYTLVNADGNGAFIRSMLQKYKECGLLPKWELGSCETTCMIGAHAVSVIADAWSKGECQFDTLLALQACLHATGTDRDRVDARIPRSRVYGCMPQLLDYKESLGYFPCDRGHESVSQGLEFVYNDYLNAQMLRRCGRRAEAAHYDTLAQGYRNYYDSTLHLMRPRMADGSWAPGFDPYALGGEFGYTEGNAWQWTWFVPHDVEGLARLAGGNEALLKRLDNFFALPMELTGRFLPDVTGLIGQYAHGNEPSHHIIYLYNRLGRPWRTQELADTILRTFYTDESDGYIGNEDCGQMSAWYVLSALGLYPICPGEPVYSIGRPLFDRAVLHLSSGRDLVITAENNSPQNRYVQSVSFNGQPLHGWEIAHDALYRQGGELHFVMGSRRP